jgi:hypothetical protein
MGHTRISLHEGVASALQADSVDGVEGLAEVVGQGVGGGDRGALVGPQPAPAEPIRQPRQTCEPLRTTWNRLHCSPTRIQQRPWYQPACAILMLEDLRPSITEMESHYDPTASIVIPNCSRQVGYFTTWFRIHGVQSS